MSDVQKLIGQKIVKVRPMTSSELDAEGWDFAEDEEPIAIELENGTVLYASQDEEGNGPGAMFGHDKKGVTFTLY